jgi:hypothetical protein
MVSNEAEANAEATEASKKHPKQSLSGPTYFLYPKITKPMLRGASAHLLLPILLLAACTAPTPQNKIKPTWEYGFWFWQGSTAEVKSPPIETIYVQAGSIEIIGDQWIAEARLPMELPPARAYWAVLRMNRHRVPDPSTIPTLAKEWKELAAQRNIKIAGVQLDIDCPTPALREYAAYLNEVRKHLPQNWQLSITALLDWFRPNTAIARVIAEVDEFVPQFYDLHNPGSIQSGPVIAAPIDAPKWAPIFNQFGRRFKIGISTFGRSRYIPPANGPAISFLDLRPFDLGINPAFTLETAKTPANEIVLRYRAIRETEITWHHFTEGATIEFVLSTPEAIAASVAEARKMGPWCGGVLFFRWPGTRETMAAFPDEVLTAAGAAAIPANRPTLKTDDERCAAVHCATLTLTGLPSLPAKPIRYRVTSTTDLEYFLPEKNIPVRLTGPRSIELTMPAYAGRMDLQLGRAVAARPTTYTLEVLP